MWKHKGYFGLEQQVLLGHLGGDSQYLEQDQHVIDRLVDMMCETDDPFDRMEIGNLVKRLRPLPAPDSGGVASRTWVADRDHTIDLNEFLFGNPEELPV